MKRSQKAILWAIICILAIVLAAIIYAILAGQGRNQSQAVPQPGGKLTARQATKPAGSWLDTWQPDAVLLKLNGSLSKGGDTASGWTINAYSASAKKIAVLWVQGDEVKALREVPALYSQTPLPEAQWQVDSDKAIARWWTEGGQAVWEDADTTSLDIRLGLNDSGRLTWLITTRGASETHVSVWEIAADTGEVLKSAAEGAP